MTLNYKQITDITFGASYIEQTNGKIIFHRFTKEEEELYKSAEYNFYKKAFANSCITLEFSTDSSSLYIKSHITPRSSRTFFSHDIFVNDKLCGVLNGKFEYDEDIETGKTVEADFLLGEKGIQKNIRIHLPWSCSSDIIELSIDDEAVIFPTKKSRKMLFYGDSITQGYDAEYTSNSYASRVALNLNVEARNKGIGGEIFRPELAEITNKDFEPDIITVAYGTNDWSAGISKKLFENRTDDFFKALVNNYPNTKIFAISPIWRSDFESQSALGKFSEIKECFDQIAKKYSNIMVIDGFDFVPHDCELFSDKSLHPNDEGFSYYANQLTKELKKHL